MAGRGRKGRKGDKKPYAEQVSEKIIAQLKAGTAPWQRPWKPGASSLPYNVTTGKAYRGMNSMWLQMQGYGDPRWLTYKQAQGAGAQVRKGESGTTVRYWKFHEEQVLKGEDGKPILDGNGKKKTIRVELDKPRVFYANVFNAEQVDGLPALVAKTHDPEPERHARAEAILAASGADIRHHPGNRAYYAPLTDQITLPEMNQFHSADGYYATALHELGHWTGHESRLNRDLTGGFGSEKYAREELRAEIASLMIGDELEIGHDPGQHAAYVGSWIKALEEDHNEIFRAASDAEKITHYVLGFEREQELEQEQEAGEKQEAPDMAGQRIWLDVPYEEKELAKASGAKWDWKEKRWYAPAGVDLDETGLARWIEREEQTPLDSFREALEEAGLRLDGEIIADGKIHRVPVEGDRAGQKSGAYALHLDDMFPGGYVENFKTGERINWKHSGGTRTPLTAEERKQLAAEIEAKKALRERQERQQQEDTAEAAHALWNGALPASGSHPYAQAKGMERVAEHGLRIVPLTASERMTADGVEIAETAAEATTARNRNPEVHVFLAGDLLVPMVDTENRLWGVQTINTEQKSFMRGGRKAGLFSVAGVKVDEFNAIMDADPAKPLIVAEGYATADTVARLLETPVVAAFDAGNLDAVSAVLKERFPDRPLIIAADNDHERAGEIMPNGKPRPNVGLEKAHEAARKHGGKVISPTFQRGEHGSDWNDYAALKGDAVAALVLKGAMATTTQGREQELSRSPQKTQERSVAKHSQLRRQVVNMEIDI